MPKSQSQKIEPIRTRALQWLLEQQKKVDNSRLVHGMAVTKEIDYDVFTNAMDKQALDCGYRA